MDIKINKSNLAKTKINKTDMLNKISTNRAILFTGAGFSLGSKSIAGNPPLAKELSNKICDAGGFDRDSDLTYAVDYFIEKNGSQSLIDILKKEFTLTKVSEEQKNICSINWLSFYTTNYDRSIEISCNESGTIVQLVNLDSPTNACNPRVKNCLHINGDIDSLNQDSLEKGFKLTDSSYVTPNSFVNSKWYSKFKIDLERSSAVIFIGYSLFDIQIKHFLIENADIKEKTYFIVAEDAEHKEIFSLSKYGSVIPIGVTGFSKLINDNRSIFNDNATEHKFITVQFPSISNIQKDIEDKHIENFLMYGVIEQHFIDVAITGEQIVPYLIKREDALSQIYFFVEQGLHVLILSGFGNGKTVLLKQLIPYLLVRSVNVVVIDNAIDDYVSDIEELSKQDKQYTALIDNYHQYLDIIKYCQESNVNNINFILSSRTTDHQTYQNSLNEANLKYQEVYIDELNDNEIEKFVDIADNLSWGGLLKNPSRNNKIKFIKDKNKGQLSLTLLSVFNSQDIKSKVDNLLENLITDTKSKSTFFSILLLNVMNVEPSFSIISDVAENECIYDGQFSNNDGFKQLFSRNSLNVRSISNIFCVYLIKNHFITSYISSQLLNIAKNFDVNIGERRNQREDTIFKSTLKFSFVERIFPDDNKKSMLENYYRELKNNITWLTRDPHFWLQYGMSCITYNDYERAQKYLDDSYAFARYKKGQYHTKNIDNQQARLFLLQAISSNIRPQENYTFFEKADKLLSNLDNDAYKFRQVLFYKKYYISSNFKTLPNKNKDRFLNACKNMLHSISESDVGQDRRFQVITDLEEIIELNKKSVIKQ